MRGKKKSNGSPSVLVVSKWSYVRPCTSDTLQADYELVVSQKCSWKWLTNIWLAKFGSQLEAPVDYQILLVTS